MNIVVTGAAGFIGKMVVEALAGRTDIQIDGSKEPIDRILAVDVAQEPLSALAKRYACVESVCGNLGDESTLSAIQAAAPGLVIHLAAVVSSAAEADFDLGMRVNLDGTVALVNVCRAMPSPPVFIFSSSVAVLSCKDNQTMRDTDPAAPLSSYGTQKLMGEYLVRDASRRGFIRGRAIRFPTISVRPGKPNKAASSFASGIVREPLAGAMAELPVDRSLRLHLASPAKALSYTLQAISLHQETLGLDTTLTLPGISVTVDEMLQTLERVAGADVAQRVIARPDPEIDRIVTTWPGQIVTPRAESLGFSANTDFAEIIREHMNSQAARH